MSKSNSFRGAATVGAVAAALAGGYALRGKTVVAQQAPEVHAAPVVRTPATDDAAKLQDAFAAVSDAANPAVVTITTERVMHNTSLNPRGGQPGDPFGGQGGGTDPFEDFFKRFRDFGFKGNSLDKEQLRNEYYHLVQRSGGLGSGMIYRADGLILTNNHVVENADTVTVKLSNGKEYKHAKVLGADERTDVAVVKINADNLPTVKLGDSSKVRVGDWAIAVGNPFGLEHTMTVGIISAKAREVPLNERSPGDYLQTDASINPGNSGGPLLDIYGRVIGINNAIYSQSGGNVGIGFAVPINTARDIADRLVKSGKITRAYLGVKISNVEDRAAALGLDPNTKGVLIESVDPNTPGGRAGLQVGDVVVSFNGQAVARSAELQRLVGDAQVGSTASLGVLRGGKNITLPAKLEELKEGAAASPAAASTTPGEEDGSPTTSALGLKLRTLTPDVAMRLGLKDAHGVLVVGVDDGSPAGAAGIKSGDVIERVAQSPVTTAPALQAAVKSFLAKQTGDDKSVALYVNRKGDRRFIYVDVNP